MFGFGFVRWGVMEVRRVGTAGHQVVGESHQAFGLKLGSIIVGNRYGAFDALAYVQFVGCEGSAACWRGNSPESEGIASRDKHP